MPNIFTDVLTAVKLTGEIRKVRKSGASAAQIKPVYTVPYVTFKPAYLNTIEGCLTWKCGRDADRAVMEVFKSLPYEVQRRLDFSPQEPGEWVERARFWQQQLKPVLPPKMYYSVILQLLEWYIHCIKVRKEGVTEHG